MPAKVQSLTLPSTIFGEDDTAMFGNVSGRGANMNDNESPLYTTDEFRMYCFKVLPCSKRYCHDWTTCPFAHPGEKAKRRDPRLFCYTGTACPEMKKNLQCPRGESCPYAHNVFEYWLHPSRYRTQLCNDGSNCKRKVCFFAHSLQELRMPANKAVNQFGMEGCADGLLPSGGPVEDPFAYGSQSYASSPVSVLSRDSWDSGTGSSNSNITTPPNSWAPTYVQKNPNPTTTPAPPSGGVSAAMHAAVAAASTAASVNALASKISEMNLNSSEQQSLIDFLKSVVQEVAKCRPGNPPTSACYPAAQMHPHMLEASLMRQQSNGASPGAHCDSDYGALPALSASPCAQHCSAPMMMSPPHLRSSKSLPFPLRHTPEESVTNSGIAQFAGPYRTLSATEQIYQQDPFLRNLEAYSKMLQAAGGPQQSGSDPTVQLTSGGSYSASSSSADDDAATADQSPHVYNSPPGVSADMLFKYLHGQMP